MHTFILIVRYRIYSYLDGTGEDTKITTEVLCTGYTNTINGCQYFHMLSSCIKYQREKTVFPCQFHSWTSSSSVVHRFMYLLAILSITGYGWQDDSSSRMATEGELWCKTTTSYTLWTYILTTCSCGNVERITINGLKTTLGYLLSHSLACTAHYIPDCLIIQFQ